MDKLIDVATAIIFGRGENFGKCLYSLRPDNVLRPNVWEHPGGKRKRGETMREAAIRECREELGVEIAIIGDLTVVSIDLVKHIIVVGAVAAQIVEGEPKPLASKELRWMDPQHVVDYMPCQPGVFLTHRAIMSWMDRMR